jgi:hypothetical protein
MNISDGLLTDLIDMIGIAGRKGNTVVAISSSDDDLNNSGSCSSYGSRGNRNSNILGCDKFVDAIRLRYQKVPHNLPDKCDGCGSTFSVGHAHQCKTGGLIIRRHDEINRELAFLTAMNYCLLIFC